MNPCKIQTGIDSLCGVVEGVEYQRSGGLIIKTKNIEQTKKLLAATTFPCTILFYHIWGAK